MILTALGTCAGADGQALGLEQEESHVVRCLPTQSEMEGFAA